MHFKTILALIACCMVMFSIAFAMQETVTDESSAVSFDAITITTPAPTAEPVPTPNPDRFVNVSVKNRKDVYRYGDTVVFTANLFGYEWCPSVSFQWQVNKGEEWEDVSGETAQDILVVISEDNLNWRWRVKVICN